MSDINDINQGRPVGVTGGVHVATAAEAAYEAGGTQPGTQAPALAELRAHIERVIEESNLPDHHRMMSKTKADELLYWITAGRHRKPL